MKFKLTLISFLILDIFLFTFWVLGYKKANTIPYPELAEFESSQLSFSDLSKMFTKIAETKGAPYAYELLKIAPMPPNTDLHLLGHVVGDILYKQKGATGIQICTQDFRNACSHSIVVGLFTDKGEKALEEIENACKKAPGGVGAYIMCYHGLGHGILAYEGYDIPKTINLCQKSGTPQHGNQEYPECVSGAVMEIISGGGHDHEAWAQQRPKYLKADNPFYLCSPPLMPEAARGRCYDYITPYLWEAIEGNIGNPTQEDFEKSFKLCEQIIEENYKNICYGGFGKEFVGLAQGRDIRRVDQMDEAKLKKIVGWCDLAPNKQAITACLGSALSSIYWGGENDRGGSIRFCEAVEDAQNQKYCFQNLINQVSVFIKDSEYRNAFCQEIPDTFSNECKKVLDN